MQLVTIAKNGECLAVHPDTLDEHQKLGWVVCDAQEAQHDAPAIAEDAPDAPKRRGRPPKKAE